MANGGEKLKPLADFFGETLAAYEKARRQAAFCAQRSYSFGPSELYLETLSPELDKYFRHALGPGLADARKGGQILVWDERSTGVPCPSPPWGGLWAYTRRGDIPAYRCERFQVSYNAGSGVLSLFDRRERIGIYWTRSAAELPGWERTAPLRTLLHWYGLLHGLQLTHGAVVHGLLLAGKGGSGKSTTALACLAAGLPILCDDYCFTRANPEPIAYAIYTNARIYEHALQSIPALSKRRQTPSDDKIALELGSEICLEMPLKALVLPQVATDYRGECLQKANSAEGMRGLTLVTMAQLAGAGKESFAILHELCHRLPNYRLYLNRPASEIPLLLTQQLCI